MYFSSITYGHGTFSLLVELQPILEYLVTNNAILGPQLPLLWRLERILLCAAEWGIGNFGVFVYFVIFAAILATENLRAWSAFVFSKIVHLEMNSDPIPLFSRFWLLILGYTANLILFVLKNPRIQIFGGKKLFLFGTRTAGAENLSKVNFYRLDRYSDSFVICSLFKTKYLFN